MRLSVVWLIGGVLLARLVLLEARAQGPSTQPATTEPRKSIAIISVLGTQVFGVTRGLTRFNDDLDVVNANWGLDALMFDQVASALAKQFEIRQVAFDYAAILQASRSQTVFSKTEPLVDELRRQVPAGTTDLLIVVRLTEVSDQFSGMPKVGIGGYGVIAINSPIFGRSVGRAFLICSMIVVDGVRMEKRREQVCSNAGGFTDPKVPFRKLDEPMTKARLPNYAPEQQIWLREALQAMVVETVPLTLAKLKLAEIDRPAAPETNAPREESTRWRGCRRCQLVARRTLRGTRVVRYVQRATSAVMAGAAAAIASRG